MEFLREKLISGEKTRTNRPASEFREKCNVGDIMHNFINLRSPERERLFDAKVIERISWNILNAPITCSDDKAKTIKSPIPEESWYEFAIKDGFDHYLEFLGYFMFHPTKFLDFFCYKFEKIRDYQKLLTSFIGGTTD